MKRQLILGLVLAVLILISVGAFFFVDSYKTQKEKEEAKQAAALQLCSFSADDVNKLDLHTPDFDYTIEKNDSNSWEVTSGETLHINTYYVDALCTYGCSLTAAEDIGTADDTALNNYGLSDPVTITYYLSDNTQKTLYIGSQTPTKENFYVMHDDDDHVYLVNANIAGYLYITQSQLRYRYIMEDKESEIIDYYLEKDGAVIYHMQKEDNQWSLTQPIDTPLQLDLSSISNLSTTLLELEADDFGDSGITEDAYASYGFDNPAYQFRFTQENGNTTTLLFAEYDPMTTSYVDCLCKETGQILVFESTYISFLQDKLENYLTNTICKVTIDNASEVDFQYQGSFNDKTVDVQAHMTLDTENQNYSFNNITIDANSTLLEPFTNFYNSLMNLSYESVETISEIPNINDAVLRLTYTLQDGSVQTIQLVPRDDKTYWAFLNGRFTYAVVRQRELSGDGKILECYTALSTAASQADA